MLSRRTALKCLATGAAALLLPRKSGAQPAPAPDALRLAFIGVGGQGYHAVEALTDQHYVAFADVDERSAARAYSAHPSVPRYRDFRTMLDRHAAGIDAIIISTPDHSHCPIALACMARGKHVYIEKPLAPTAWECRAMAQAATRHRVKTQLGIQGHSTSGLRMLREWIDAGVAGRVTELHLWTDRMQPARYHWSESLPEGQPVPPELDWDLWLAGRPARPYNGLYVPNHWRNWWGFGTGPIGDIGVHMFDVVEFALEVGFPEWVEAEVPAISPFTAPPWSRARWHYAAAGPRPALDLHWYNGTRDGILQRPEALPHVPPEVLAGLTNAIVFVGTEGTLLVEDMRVSARPRLYPLEKERSVLTHAPARRLPRVAGNHFDDFFRAIREDGQAGAHLGYGAPLTEAVLLGTLAQRTGKRIRWDREKMQAIGIPETEAMVRPEISPAWING